MVGHSGGMSVVSGLVDPVVGAGVAEGGVTVADLEEWSAELERLLAWLGPLFPHSGTRRHAGQYLRGLLSPLERKNGWTIAEHAGEADPKALQRFVNQAVWDAEGLRDLLYGWVGAEFDDPGAVLVADPTGFAKKGTRSAGVQRQYSGTLGRVDNCQIGTFLAYVAGSDRVLVDRELYLPKSWISDPTRCAQAGVPAGTGLVTRPQQVIAMIGRARDCGLRFAWFTADEEFGQNPELCAWLRAQRIPYVLGVPRSTLVQIGGRCERLEDHAARVRGHDWQRRACGLGTKGYRVYEWAVLDPDPGEGDSDQYLVRRSPADQTLAFYRVHNPRGEGLTEVVRVVGARWPIEECFEATKTGVGLDHYQVRLYHAWYRHITLAMWAHAFLVGCVRRHRTPPDPAKPTKRRSNPTLQPTT